MIQTVTFLNQDPTELCQTIAMLKKEPLQDGAVIRLAIHLHGEESLNGGVKQLQTVTRSHRIQTEMGSKVCTLVKSTLAELP